MSKHGVTIVCGVVSTIYLTSSVSYAALQPILNISDVSNSETYFADQSDLGLLPYQLVIVSGESEAGPQDEALTRDGGEVDLFDDLDVRSKTFGLIFDGIGKQRDLPSSTVLENAPPTEMLDAIASLDGDAGTGDAGTISLDVIATDGALAALTAVVVEEEAAANGEGVSEPVPSEETVVEDPSVPKDPNDGGSSTGSGSVDGGVADGSGVDGVAGTDDGTVDQGSGDGAGGSGGGIIVADGSGGTGGGLINIDPQPLPIDGDGTGTDDASNVPLPAALPLLASALGLLGFRSWRSRRS